MARRLSYSARHDHPAETVYQALATRQFWDDMMVEFRKLTPRSDVESFVAGDDGIDVVLVQTIPKGDLPALAASVIKKDLVITRTEKLGPFHAEKTEGTYTAAIPAGPGNLTGVQELFPTETGATLRRNSEVKVFIPFVNGKLEQLVLVHLVDLFRGEAEFTADWIAANC